MLVQISDNWKSAFVDEFLYISSIRWLDWKTLWWENPSDRGTESAWDHGLHKEALRPGQILASAKSQRVAWQAAADQYRQVKPVIYGVNTLTPTKFDEYIHWKIRARDEVFMKDKNTRMNMLYEFAELVRHSKCISSEHGNRFS